MEDKLSEEIRKVEKIIDTNPNGIRQDLGIIYDYLQSKNKDDPRINEFKNRALGSGYNLFEFDKWISDKKKIIGQN